jgi:hypothetical protein
MISPTATMESPTLMKTAWIQERAISDDGRSTRSNTHLLPKVRPSLAIRPITERQDSRTFPGWKGRRIHAWKAPLLMFVFLLLGWTMSVAHCVFYPKLKGQIVGKADQQEEKIRYYLH